MDIKIFYKQFGENRVNNYFVARLNGDKLSYDKAIEETVIYFQKLVDGEYEDYMSKISNQFN
jgi:hypothetical protein